MIENCQVAKLAKSALYYDYFLDKSFFVCYTRTKKKKKKIMTQLHVHVYIHVHVCIQVHVYSTLWKAIIGMALGAIK